MLALVRSCSIVYVHWWRKVTSITETHSNQSTSSSLGSVSASVLLNKSASCFFRWSLLISQLCVTLFFFFFLESRSLFAFSVWQSNQTVFPPHRPKSGEWWHGMLFFAQQTAGCYLKQLPLKAEVFPPWAEGKMLSHLKQHSSSNALIWWTAASVQPGTTES